MARTRWGPRWNAGHMEREWYFLPRRIVPKFAPKTEAGKLKALQKARSAAKKVTKVKLKFLGD